MHIWGNGSICFLFPNSNLTINLYTALPFIHSILHTLFKSFVLPNALMLYKNRKNMNIPVEFVVAVDHTMIPIACSEKSQTISIKLQASKASLPLINHVIKCCKY